MPLLKSLALTLSLVLLCSGVARSGEPGDAAAPEQPAAEAPTDVLKEVLARNGADAAKPPTEFRSGHVTPRSLDAKALTKTESGFSIRLPSGAPIATPTVEGGRLFVSGGFHSKEFYAFDAKTGEYVWGIGLDDDGPSSAVVEDDVVVFNTESCTVFAVDAKSGKQLWSLWLGDPLMSTPAVHDGRVFTAYPAAGRVGAHAKGAGPAKGTAPTTHVFCALDLKTGKILWQRWIDSDVMTAPVVSGGRVYASSFGGTLYEFAPASGEILAAKRYRATSSPTVVAGKVFVTRRADGAGQAVQESFGCLDEEGTLLFEANKKVAKYLDAEVQRRSTFRTQSMKLDAANGFAGGAPAAANGAAGLGNIGQGNVSSFQAFQGSRALHFREQMFNTMGDELVCVDPKSGKTSWKVKIAGDLVKSGGFLATSPAAAGDALFVATLDGRVLMLDPEKGEVRRTWKTGAPIRFQPAVVDGRIYVGTQDGRVVMVDTGDRSYTGWTTWGGNGRHTGVVGPRQPAKK